MASPTPLEFERRIEREGVLVHRPRAARAQDADLALDRDALERGGYVPRPPFPVREFPGLEPVGAAAHADVNPHPIPGLLEHLRVDASGAGDRGGARAHHPMLRHAGGARSAGRKGVPGAAANGTRRGGDRLFRSPPPVSIRRDARRGRRWALKLGADPIRVPHVRRHRTAALTIRFTRPGVVLEHPTRPIGALDGVRRAHDDDHAYSCRLGGGRGPSAPIRRDARPWRRRPRSRTTGRRRSIRQAGPRRARLGSRTRAEASGSHRGRGHAPRAWTSRDPPTERSEGS